jgi:hypothetical protein
MVIWVQNVRFIAKIGSKLKGKRQKNMNTKKTQVPDIFFNIFFQNRQFQVNCYHIQISKIKFSNIFFQKRTQWTP